MNQRELPGADQEPPERTINGATFTAGSETMRVYDALVDQAAKAAAKTLPAELSDFERRKKAMSIAEEKVSSPTCGKKISVCKTTTCYMVYADLPRNIFKPKPEATLNGKRYFAINICVACGAWLDGFEDGKDRNLTQRKRRLNDLKDSSLTDLERGQYRQEYERGYTLGAKERAARKKEVGSLDRYQPKKKEK